jgi:hypothetical protein
VSSLSGCGRFGYFQVSSAPAAGEAGFEPLGFVVGSSIYHIGLQIAANRWLTTLCD